MLRAAQRRLVLFINMPEYLNSYGLRLALYFHTLVRREEMNLNAAFISAARCKEISAGFTQRMPHQW